MEDPPGESSGPAKNSSGKRRPARTSGDGLLGFAAPGGTFDLGRRVGALIFGVLGLGVAVLGVVLTITTGEPVMLFLAFGGLVFAAGGWFNWRSGRKRKRR